MSVHSKGYIFGALFLLSFLLLLPIFYLLLLSFLCLAFVMLDIPLPLSSQVRSCKPLKNGSVPEGLSVPKGFGLSRVLYPCTSRLFPPTLVETLLQEQREVVVGTHLCATLALDHVSATLTYVEWR